MLVLLLMDDIDTTRPEHLALKVLCGPCLVSRARECTAPSALQVRAAAEEYHAEFAAKETTIITLTAEAEATRAHMQGEIEKLRTEMEVSAAVTDRSWRLQLPRKLNMSQSTWDLRLNTCAARWRCVLLSNATSQT